MHEMRKQEQQHHHNNLQQSIEIKWKTFFDAFLESNGIFYQINLVKFI